MQQNQEPQVQRQNLNEILSKDIPIKDRISPTTQKLINSKITGFFNYCLDEYPDFVGSNIFRNKYQQTSFVKLKVRSKVLMMMIYI